MSLRIPMLSWILLVWLCYLPLATAWAESPQPSTPNVVVIFVDDMGYADPSCFGNPKMKTPNIDRLANEGIKLTNFYVNSPICSASRVALTTGQYQQRYRIHSYLASRQANQKRKMPDWLDPNAPTLAKLLQSKGYRTAHFGKWHMGGGRDVDDAPLPQAYGFEESLVSFEGLGDRILWQKSGNQELSWKHGKGQIHDLPKHKTTETYVDRAIDFITRNKTKPFYVRVFPNDVHDGHFPSDAQLAEWTGTSTNPPDIPFFAVLDNLDQQVGRLVETIDQLGLGENTLILFTSDNGPTDWPRYYKQGHQPPGFTGPFLGRKWSLFEGGIRMPFIARWKGKILANSTNTHTIMAAIDILPTVASICGLSDQVQATDGEDLSAVFMGKTIQRKQPLFWEYGVHGSIKPGKTEHISPRLAMRHEKWKLLCNPDGSERKLFNLTLDSGETTNLAEQQPQITNEMQQRLLAWWSEMNAYYPSKTQVRQVTSQPSKSAITIKKIEGRDWLLTAKGKPFFAHGITHVNNQRVKLDFQKISTECKKLGFTAYGYGCPPALRTDLPYIDSWNHLVPISTYRGKKAIRFIDVFDPAEQAKLEKGVRTVCNRSRGNSNCIGYCWTDLGAWPLKNSTETNWVEFMRELPDTAPGKRAYLAFEAKWKGNDPMARDLAFLRLIAREYFRVVGEANRKHDPNRLILGDRFAFNTFVPEVMEEMLPWVDAIAIQPPFWGPFPQKKLDEIHRLSGKPILLCDFAIRFKDGDKDVRNWKLSDDSIAAGKAYEAYVKAAFETDYVIGVFWCNPVDTPKGFGKPGVKQGFFADELAVRPGLHESVRQLNTFLKKQTPSR